MKVYSMCAIVLLLSAVAVYPSESLNAGKSTVSFIQASANAMSVSDFEKVKAFEGLREKRQNTFDTFWSSMTAPERQEWLSSTSQLAIDTCRGVDRIIEAKFSEVQLDQYRSRFKTECLTPTFQ
jgi:hypothetical protein